MTSNQHARTEQLIATLAGDGDAIERLASPHWRMLVWFSVALVYAAIVVAVVGIRSDVVGKLNNPWFIVEISAGLMTSMLAAAAAFCAGCPGRPVWERFAPIPALLVWFGVLGLGCWQSWLRFGNDALRLQLDLICLPCILLIALLPGGLILAMVRKGAPIAPVTTMALASLAAAALSAVALRLFYVQDSDLMVLTWQFGSVILLTVLGAFFGSRVLRWPQDR